MVVPEVRSAISMLEFTAQNPDGFTCKGNIYPFALANMKMIAGFMTEAVNIMIIVKSRTTYDILYDFVALKVIAEIDDIMAQTLRMEKINVDEEIEEAHNKHTYESKNRKDIMAEYKKIYKRALENKENCLYSAFLWLANITVLFYSKAAKLVYNLFYYYFMPFVVVLLVILYGMSIEEINQLDYEMIE